MEIRINHYTIRHHEAGSNGTLRLAPLFDFLQDTAAEHAAELHFGMEDLADKGFLWVLSRIRMEIRRMPSIGEKIAVKTYPNGTDKLFARRQFTLTGENGETLVRAGSLWLVIDRERQRPVRPESGLGIPLPKNENEALHFPEIGKLPEISESAPLLAEYEVGHSQIDVNRHLNNAFYAAFVEDLRGISGEALPAPRELQINFLHAGLPGERILCRGEKNSDGSLFEGRLADGKTISFQAFAR